MHRQRASDSTLLPCTLLFKKGAVRTEKTPHSIPGTGIVRVLPGQSWQSRKDNQCLPAVVTELIRNFFIYKFVGYFFFRSKSIFLSILSNFFDKSFQASRTISCGGFGLNSGGIGFPFLRILFSFKILFMKIEINNSELVRIFGEEVNAQLKKISEFNIHSRCCVLPTNELQTLKMSHNLEKQQVKQMSHQQQILLTWALLD